MSPSESKMKGVWWKASAPEEKLHGEITFGHTTGATVDLYGAFPTLDAEQSKSFTLLGTTFKDQLISLFRCHTPRKVSHSPGREHSTISSSFGIVGAHVDDANELRFTKLELEITHLHDWTNISGIRQDAKDTSDQRIFRHSYPPSIAVGSIGNVSASIEFPSLSYTHALGALTLEEGCELVLRSEEFIDYSEFQVLIDAIQAFLCIAAQRPVFVKKCTGDSTGLNSQRPSGKRSRQITFIHRLSSPLEDVKHIVPEQMLFALSDLSEPFNCVFERFAFKREQLRPSLDLYLSTVYSTDQVPRAVYLTLAQAVEGYHRVTLGGCYMADETYQNGLKQVLIDALPKGVSKEFRSSLMKKFDYLHEYSLRKRIGELVRRHAIVLVGLLGKPSDFASIISELRNALTHPSSAGHPDSQDPLKVWRLSQSLALLLEVCFLTEFGISEQDIVRIVQTRSDRARRIHFTSR